jgi:hypothetical protein
MNLNELTGVKQYKDMQLPDLITKVMSDNGFEKLGEGSFGVAYKRPGDNYVYKLYVADAGYSQFIEYAQSHSSPHLPRIFGSKSLSAFWKRPPKNIDERLYVAKVEYITPAEEIDGDDGYNMVNLINSRIRHELDIDALDDHTKEMAVAAMSFAQEIQSLVRETNSHTHDLDLTTNNVGFRSNGDVVMIDPLFKTGKSGEHPLKRRNSSFYKT